MIISVNALKELSGLLRAWKNLLIVQLTTEIVLSSEMDPTVSGINRKVVLIGVQAWDIRLQGFYEIQACDLWTRPKNPNFDCLGLKIACLYLFSLVRFQILSALA